MTTPRGAKPITRILLSEAASQALDATGDRHFAIVGKERVSGYPGRWVIYLRPANDERAKAALEVMRGQDNQQFTEEESASEQLEIEQYRARESGLAETNVGFNPHPQSS